MRLIIVAAILAHILATQGPRQHRNLLSARMFMDLALLFMFGYGVAIEGKLADTYDLDSLCRVILVGIAALYLGQYGAKPLIWVLTPGINLTKRSLPRLLSLKKMAIPLAIFAVVILISIWDSARFGNLSLFAQFTGARLSTYGQRLSEGSSSTVANLVCYLLPIPAIAMTLAIKKHRIAVGLIIYLFTLFAFLASFSTRLWVLTVFSLPVAYYNAYIRRIRIRALVAGLVVAAVAFAALNIWRSSGMDMMVEAILSGRIQIEVVGAGLSNDLNPVGSLYEMVAADDTGALVHERGATYWFIVETFVPRAIWQDKPFTSFANRWTRQMYGSVVAANGQANVSTFTVWGEGLTQFGLPGVLLNLLMYGLIVGIAEMMYSSRPELAVAQYCWSLQAAFCLRGEIGAIFLFSVLSLIVSFAVLGFCEYNSGSNGSPANEVSAAASS